MDLRVEEAECISSCGATLLSQSVAVAFDFHAAGRTEPGRAGPGPPPPLPQPQAPKIPDSRRRRWGRGKSETPSPSGRVPVVSVSLTRSSCLHPCLLPPSSPLSPSLGRGAHVVRWRPQPAPPRFLDSAVAVLSTHPRTGGRGADGPWARQRHGSAECGGQSERWAQRSASVVLVLSGWAERPLVPWCSLAAMSRRIVIALAIAALVGWTTRTARWPGCCRGRLRRPLPSRAPNASATDFAMPNPCCSTMWCLLRTSESDLFSQIHDVSSSKQTPQTAIFSRKIIFFF